MSIGLIAILDDVVGLAKVAAASVDNIAGQAAKAGAKWEVREANAISLCH